MPVPLPAPAKSPTQTRLACDALRERIIAGELAPGAKLNIALLALELGVSNGAVREALAMLEPDALVVSEPQRGFRVSLISAEDLVHLTAARIAVEKLCLADAMQHGGVEWESALVAALHRLKRSSEARRADREVAGDWAAVHAEFHRALVQGCRNPWLLAMRETLYQQSERYRRFVEQSAPKSRNVGAEHRALADAALARDAARVEQLMAEHLSRTTELAIKALQRQMRQAA